MQGPGRRIGVAALAVTALAGSWLAAPALAAPAGAAPAAPVGCAPGITALPLPADATTGTVVAGSGDYAVGTTRGPEPEDLDHATLWHLGRRGWTVTSLAALAPIGTTSASVAGGVNARGQAVVTSWSTGLGTAFVYDHGTLHQLHDTEGGTVARAAAISASGVIVGGTRAPMTGLSVAARWASWSAAPVVLSGSQPHGGDALAVDDAGVVAGHVGLGGNYGVFPTTWRADGSESRLGLGPGIRSALASDTDSTARRTVGSSWSATSGYATVWDGAGAATFLPLFDGASSASATGVSPTGVVVGTQSGFAAPGPSRAFLWPGSGPLRSLLPLSRNWTDAAQAAAVDSRGTVYGASTAVAGGAVQPTVWTCARQQSFVPPTGGVAAG